MNRLLVVIVVSAGLGLSTTSWAGDHARLTVTREASAADCPDEQALRDAVGARLGYEAFVLDAPSEVSVVFRRKGETLHASVTLRDAAGHVKGERALSSARGDCEEVAQATTLTISILLDPRSGLAPAATAAPDAAPSASVSAPAEPSAAPATPAEPKPSPEPAAPPEPPSPAKSKIDSALTTAASAPAERLRLLLTAGGTASLGNAPVPLLGFLVGAGVAGQRWSVSAELRADFPADGLAESLDVSLDELSDSLAALRVHTRFMAVNLVPCGSFGLGYACAVLSLGSLHGEVVGASPASQGGFHALIGPRFGLALPLSRALSFDVHVEGGAALTKTAFRAAGQDLWSTPTWSGALGIGLMGRYP